MILQENGVLRKVSVAIFICDKIYFKVKKVTRDKNRYFTMIKGSNTSRRHSNS